ncbi:DUF6240 domain-containing protein [Butyrivibrio proteoclasticus]|uniref:DUF6240 domain-containing protein n=1 Tax=Butyrivibrio proteoclasticus TaxID=43305 RepID=UPI000478B538|nr:DUF6240 domain-containing protein [Butyrivibrio proteoclasticus]
MNITFQNVSDQKTGGLPVGTEVERSNIGSRPVDTKKAAYQVDLKTSIFSNEAYAQHTRSAEDISDLAQDTDVKWQHNYMALLSNTLSEEDYAKAAEDGFDLKDLNDKETVTILDKIKSVLLMSGKEITGYNDDISTDKLSKIVGSQSFANALKQSFKENDIPLTPDNAKSAKQAYEQISEISELSDDAVKYMVLNSMSPTIENVYLASHSTNGVSVNGRGYYAQDAGGYYAQKADSFDWEQLSSQIEKVVEEAGLDVTDESVKGEAKWIVEQGIPLNPDNLVQLDQIKEISFPISEELAAKAISAAIADGKKPVMANLSDPSSNSTKAKEILEQTRQISDENIKSVIASEKELNLHNLFSAGADKDVPSSDPKFLEARLQLEEVRLRMTFEANKQLLNSGFSIDTAPMQELIDALKAQLASESIEATSSVFEMTVSRASTIAKGPADVIGSMASRLATATLTDISVESTLIASRYKKAGESYEALMTAPRKDLGDRIEKAFQNVDDILEDLELEANDDNRRAVRILGYNKLEINQKAIEEVKGWDQLVRATVERLKPGAVMDLIKEGKNPLGMTIEQLSQSLDEHLNQGNDGDGQGKDKSREKYSKFLYKLEKKGDITEEEKQSFIGIYRLFNTIKKDDYKAIGSVLKTGQEMNIKNLLEATRSFKKSQRGMDYVVDDDFGGLSTRSRSLGLKIDEQINLAFRFYSAKADIIYENLEPEKLQAANPTENTLLTELADRLVETESDKDLDKQYYAEQARHIRETLSGKEATGALDEMTTLDVEVTFSNLEAMIGARRDRRSGSIWEKTKDVDEEEIEKEQQLLVDALSEDDYPNQYKDSLRNISDKLSDVLMNEDDTYIDVRSITLMQKQLSVMSKCSDRGSFDVPIDLDGQKISMHITLRSDDSMNSRMEASVQTYEYGLITASLYVSDGIINGILSTTNGNSSEESEYLEGVRTKLCDKMAEKLKGLGINQERIGILYHAQIKPSSVGQVNANAKDGNLKEFTDTKVFLTMAKAFIEAL